jgi:hypothetical protein
MKFALIISAIVLFCVAAVLIFLAAHATAPLGLIAVGLACATASKVIP